ncbi:unnamed protein product, partial [Allacma fusca]
ILRVIQQLSENYAITAIQPVLKVGHNALFIELKFR